MRIFGFWFFMLQVIVVTQALTAQTVNRGFRENIGEACTSDGEECSVPNSYCDPVPDPNNPTCKCSADYVPEGDILCKATTIDQPCSSTDQCKDFGESECIGNSMTCKCNTGHFPSETKTTCVPFPSLINDLCDSDLQCSSIVTYSTCDIKTGERVGSCICDNQHIVSPSMDICLAKQVYFPCDDTNQCVGLVGTSFCNVSTPGSGFCECSAGYVPSGSSEKCLLSATLVQDLCEEDVQCQNLGEETATCSVPDGSPEGTPTRCFCKPNHFPNQLNEICVPFPELIEEPCESESQCSRNVTYAICDIKTGERVGSCICDDKHIVNASLDICLAKQVFFPCENDRQCSGLGASASFCNVPTSTSGRCECLPGNVPSTSETECLLSATQVGGPCIESIQCELLSNTTCTEDPVDGVTKCLCAPDLIFDGQQCIPSGLESFICSSSTECSHIPGSDCLPSAEDPLTKCRCIENFIPTSDPIKDKCLPLALIIGEPCEESVQCQRLGGTECKSVDEWPEATCECKANLHPDPTNTRCLENIPE